MTTLSLAMIVKNEEASLGHCLASVQGLVDQIVVVDTGSTDRTVEIARAHGAVVGSFAWGDDFAAARNAALDRCTGDWVLVLDADEALDARDHAVIRETLAKGKQAAYALPIRNYLPGSAFTVMGEPPTPNDGRYAEGAAYPCFVATHALRLCRKTPDLAYEGSVHEVLDAYWTRRNQAIGDCPAVIHHFGKLDLAKEAAKQPRYLAMAQGDAARHPSNAQRQFNLMLQAKLVGEWDQALQAGTRYLRLNPRPLVLALTTCAEAHLHLGQPAEALPLLERVLKPQPGHAEALHLRSRALRALGRVQDAKTCLRRGLKAAPGLLLFALDLAELELEARAFEPARQSALQGLQRHPDHEGLWMAVFQADMGLGRQDWAVEDATRALAACPGGGQGFWHWAVALGATQAGRPEEARAAVARGRALFPDHAGLRNLAARLGSA